MPVLKKINKFQGLKDLDVLVEESGLTSKYFNVVDFPSAIPKGASSFIIAGSRFLKENVELKIEILDSAGNTVYTEPIPNYLEGNARRVSIEVYDDVAPGDGFLYIVGELKDGHVDTTTSPNQSPFDPLLEELKQQAKFGNDVLDEIEELERIKEISQGNQQQSQIQNVPPAYQGIYNVRYVRPIFINSTIPNTQPIIFHGAPTITAREVVKGFIENSTADTTVTITGSGEILNLPDHTDPTPHPIDPLPFEGIKPIDFDSVENITKVLERLKNNRKNKIEVIRQPSLAVRGRVVRRASPEQEKSEFIISGLESGTENDLNKVSSALVGGTLTVNSPRVDTTKFPSDKFTIPTSFETKIKKVKNGGVCVPEDQFFVTEKDTGDRFPADILLPPDGGNTQVTMSYQPAPSQSISTTHFRSFADITVGNLRTFSGDVYKAKIYAKSRGTLGDFEKIYETPIESPQLLIDPFSTTGFTNTGYFYKQSIIDDYWTLSNGTKTQNDDKIIDGMLISGSNKGLDESIDLITSQSVELEYNVPYTIQFNTYYYKEDKQVSNNSSDVQKSARLEVYLSGSAITGVGGEDNEFLGAVDIPEGNNLEGQIDNVFNTFISSKTGDPKTQIIFKVKSGRFVISDVMLRPYSETNFNPEFFKAIVPMPHPLPKKPDNYDFLVEFFDVNNNVAETIALTENVRFQGAAFNIDGSGNLLSGSMFMGSVEGSGIEMHGGSAYVRTIGYNGFDRTIAENKGGFIMFSGSVSESLQTSQSYEGVGLELVDAHGSSDRYLRFRTNPSLFEVVTDQFFLGSESSSFISGSGGNIEISSSNFHLTNAGDVTMSGTITATAGNIGDFQIVDGQISGSNITFNANNSTIFKTDQGPGSDTSAAFDQLRDEYYIDFTPLEESPDNYYIKMGPNFMVDKDGVLIASGAKFEGTITASAGLIGGFTSDSHSLSSTNLFISGSPKTTGTYNHLNDTEYMFISTSKFNVKENGDVTGSNFLLQGGTITEDVSILGSVTANSILTPATINGAPATETNASSSISAQGFARFVSASIGGFTVKTSEISSSNGALSLKDSGQITGSNVLFDGGKIGGFTIDSDEIKSGTNIGLNSTTKAITINNTTFGNQGIQLEYNSGTPRGYIGDGNDRFFKFDGTDVELSAPKMFISSSGGGTIAMGDTIPQNLTSDGLLLSGSGDFNFQGNATNLVRKIGTALTIKSETFSLTGTDLEISNDKISIGTLSAITDVADTSTGFLVDSSGNVLIKQGGANAEYLQFNGGNVTIKSGTFSLTGTNLEISNDKISIGTLESATDIADASTGFHVDSSGNVLIKQGGANAEYLKFHGGGIDIKAGEFDLATSTLVVDSGTNSGKIALGATPNTTGSGTNAGIYMDGTGDFLAYTNATNYIRKSFADLDIKAENFDLDAGTLILDSGTNNGKIALGGTPPTAYNSGTGFYVDGDGRFLLGIHNGNRIQFDGSSTFTINTDEFELDTGTIDISTTDKRIQVFDDESSPNEIIRIGETSDAAGDLFGMKIYDGSGDTNDAATLVKFGEEGNRIAGWTIDSSNIFSDNLFIRSSGTIETADFASNVRGWRISAEGNGTAEFENARIRGTLSTAVFEKETVNAVGGQLYVANSTSITGSDITSASYTTMSVVNATGFTGSYNNDGEILQIKKVTTTGFSTEYVLVQSSSRDFPTSETNFAGKLYVVRGYSGSSATQSGSEAAFVGDIQSTPQDYEEGQVIVSTGRIGTGYIRLNANPNDQTTPYIDIVERTGSNIYDVDLKARVGDLSGVNVSEFAEFGIAPANAGFGIYTSNGYFTGGITATTGSITGKLFVHTGVGASNKIIIGTNVEGTNDGIYVNNNNYWFTDAEFKVGDSNNFIHVTGSGGSLANDIRIQSQKFELDATDLHISAQHASMSLGHDTDPSNDGGIKLKGTAGGSIGLGGVIPTNLSSDGIFLSGSGEFNLQKDSNEYIRFDSSGLEVKTENLNVDTSTFDVKTDGGGVIALGTNASTFGTEGIFMSGSGEISIYRNPTNYLIMSGSTFDLSVDDFQVSTSRLEVTSSGIEISSTQASMSLGNSRAINLDGTGNGAIQVGNGVSSVTDTGGSNKGVYIEGDGDFIFKAGANKYLQFNGGDLDLRTTRAKISGSNIEIGTTNFDLDVSTMRVSSSNDGVIALGATPPVAYNSGNGFYVDGAGKFLIGNTSGNHINFDGSSTFNIKTTQFDLETSTMRVSSSNDGVIALGQTPPLAYNNGDGFYVDGTGKFLIGDTSGNHINFDGGSTFNIKTSQFELDTPNLEISSANVSMSLGEGKILLDGDGGTGGVPIIKVDGGELSGSDFFVSTAGALSASAFLFSTNLAVDTDATINFGESNYQSFAYGRDDSLKIVTGDFNLTTNTLIVSSSDVGTIALGSTPPQSATSGNGIFLKGDGTFLFGNTSDDHINFDGSTISIKTTDIDLLTTGANKIKLDSTASTPVFAMGSGTLNSSVSGTEKGIFMDGTGNFLVRGDANNLIKFDAGGNTIQLKSDTFALDASTIIIDSATNNGKVSLGASPPTAYNNGNGFYADGQGRFLAGSSTGSRISFNGTNTLNLVTDDFHLSGSTTLRMNNSTLVYGASAATQTLTSGTGVLLNSSGHFRAGKGNGYRMSWDGTNLIMSSSTFVLGDKGSGAFISGSSDGLLTISSSGYHLSSSGEATFMTGSNQITFTPEGNIESDEYLIEKSRLFGSGADGDHTLTTGGSNIVSDDDSTTALVNNSSGTWTLQTDCYFDDLTINTGCTLLTNGFRLFVRGTLTMSGTAKIKNNGNNGGNGSNAGPGAGSGGSAGGGASGNALSTGTTGTAGGAGGTGSQSGGAGGGGSGGSGGFIFISARKIVNTCNVGSGIIAEGGDGGAGGNSIGVA